MSPAPRPARPSRDTSQRIEEGYRPTAVAPSVPRTPPTTAPATPQASAAPRSSPAGGSE